MAAVELLQLGIGAQIQTLQLVPAAVQIRQMDVGAEIQPLHAVAVAAVQDLQGQVGAQIRRGPAGIVV